jgi:hypothetical protein
MMDILDDNVPNNDADEQPRFARATTAEIVRPDKPPMRWVVPGFVGEGLSILAGRQKIGKSCLALNWAIAVACGGLATGSVGCETGNVLYIDLQNGPRRMRSRLDAIFGSSGLQPDLGRLEWTNEAPPLFDGFIEALDDWRTSVAKPRLVLIDPPQQSSEDTDQRYCAALANLQVWATAHGIGIVLMVRTHAVGRSDPLEGAGQASRLSGYADTTLLLAHDGGGFTLQVRSRDVEARRIALGLAGGVWTVLGEAQEVRFSDRHLRILEMLRTGDCALAAADVAGEFDLPIDSVRRMLARMAEAGEIERCGRGRYRHRRGGRADDEASKARIKVDDDAVMRILLPEMFAGASEMSDSNENG